MAIFARTRERQGLAQDITALQQFALNQQRMNLAGVLPSNLIFPTPRSTAGAGLFGNFLLQQQQAAAGEGVQDPFTLGPGQQRFTGGGQPIARVPVAPTPISGSFQQIADPVTGKQINALVNPETGNIIKKFGTVEQGLSSKDKIQVAVTQAKEFRTDPRIKNLNIIERSERGMQSALKLATAPGVKSRIASDQALGVLFQKMLDPESVVRESEFARTPEGAAAINRLLAIAPQLRLGGLRLLDEDRQALVTMAQKLLQEAKITANRAFDEFEIRANEIGLNKKIVFGGAKKFDIANVKPTITPTGTNNLSDIDKRIAELEAKARQ